MIPDPAPPYEVGMSDDLRAHIRRLFQRAVAMGIGTTFRDAVQRIFEDLKQDPRGVGDPVRNLRGFKMVEYHLVRDQLVAIRSHPHPITVNSPTSLPHPPPVRHRHLPVSLLPLPADLDLPNVVSLTQRGRPVLRQPVVRVHVHLEQILSRRKGRLAG
jgi:hypothetical protein